MFVTSKFFTPKFWGSVPFWDWRS